MQWLKVFQTKKVMDFAAYKEKIKKMDIAALLYARKDALEAAKAADALERKGYPNNHGYYWDEVSMLTEEINERRKSK